MPKGKSSTRKNISRRNGGKAFRTKSSKKSVSRKIKGGYIYDKTIRNSVLAKSAKSSVRTSDSVNRKKESIHSAHK
jgi:hypothetical protein